jgi:hypothetical protein
LIRPVNPVVDWYDQDMQDSLPDPQKIQIEMQAKRIRWIQIFLSWSFALQREHQEVQYLFEICAKQGSAGWSRKMASKSRKKFWLWMTAGYRWIY